MTAPKFAVTDTEAMDLIARAMSTPDWSADTLDEVAFIVIQSGRTMDPPWHVMAARATDK